jgi:cysteinyl-tRNA synthetase, unknown class
MPRSLFIRAADRADTEPLRTFKKPDIPAGVNRTICCTGAVIDRTALPLTARCGSSYPGTITVTRTMQRTTKLLFLAAAIVASATLLLSDVPGNWLAAQRGERPLLAVKSWHYQLDKLDVDTAAKVDADMMVIDYALHGGKVALTREEVARLKVRGDGRKRLLISYLSIGEAEEFRWYWNPEWKTTKPDWLVEENCAWPRAWMIKYWEKGWKDIIYAGPDAYLRRIIDAGFDGVYLDRVDMHEHTGDLNPAAKRAMIQFVTELAATARALKPSFLIIPQNGEDMLEDRGYRRVVDAIAKEELLHSSTGTGERNDAKAIAATTKHLKRLAWDYKPVFPVEYLLKPDAIAATRTEIQSLGFVPVFPTRALDGGDPTTAGVTLEKETGTPEYIATACKGKRSW